MKEIFFTKKGKGLPKSECLLTAHEIYRTATGEELDDLPTAERAYRLNITHAYIKAMRDICRNHNIVWVDVKTTGMKHVKHGFTQREELRENHLARCKGRLDAIKSIHTQNKQLINEQRQLFSD